ncbi:MAG: hypothetical protein WDM92_08965 [Caulobacteraceae bacterium]
MLGKVVGVVVGLAVAAFGIAAWKPALLAQAVDLSRVDFGPYAAYRTTVCWLIVAVGLAIVLATAQRSTERAKPRRKPLLSDEASQERPFGHEFS